jgi:hypothetical protein
MKAPVVLVAAALTVAILLTASFLIATGTRGENALRPLFDKPAGRSLRLPMTTPPQALTRYHLIPKIAKPRRFG